MYKKNVFVRVQSVDCVNYLIKNYDAYELDEIGTIVWHSLNGSTHIEEIIKLIAMQYNIEEKVVAHDVLDFCSELLENGLIEEFCND